MKFYELGDTPEDAVKLRVPAWVVLRYFGQLPDQETPEEKAERLLNVNADLDVVAELAAQQWVDNGDGDSYKGWPRVFIILDDTGVELGRRRVGIDFDPTFEALDDDIDPLYSSCDICGEKTKLGETLLECPKCNRWGNTVCCMMGGRGVPCCECEEK